jgi:opacity protein-like surface antigen
MPENQSCNRTAILLGLGILALAAPAAHAADLGPPPPPPPVETWTGFSIGVGGGIAILNADVNESASRDDQIGFCHPKKKKGHGDCDDHFKPFTTLSQSSKSNFDDLSDEGFFGTLQLAYDKQFAPRWVLGGFVDADWDSDLEATSKQSSSSTLGLNLKFLHPSDIPSSTTTIDTKVGVDWTVSVGGRVGWLATPGTLLYFLAAYTHAELDNPQVNVHIDDPLGFLDKYPHVDVGSPTNIVLRLPDSLDGFTLGGGAEAKLGGPWSLKLEYRWTHLDGGSANASDNKAECIPFGKHFGIGRESDATASADLDTDLQTVRGVLTYHFGGTAGG